VHLDQRRQDEDRNDRESERVTVAASASERDDE
jgi:hypothetical protein